jgi:hypothetical protein
MDTSRLRVICINLAAMDTSRLRVICINLAAMDTSRLRVWKNKSVSSTIRGNCRFNIAVAYNYVLKCEDKDCGSDSRNAMIINLTLNLYSKIDAVLKGES